MLLLISSSVFATKKSSQKGFNPEYSLDQMVMDQWTNENGLISSNLTSIYQSDNGFLWITSHNGLQQFDGLNFTSFTKQNSPFLNSNSFYRSYEMTGDTLWFTTERSGIVYMCKGKLHAFNLNDRIPKATITLYETKDSQLWIGTKNSGLHVKKTNGDIKRVADIPEVTINHINEDLDGNLWVASDGNGLYQITPEGIKVYTTNDGLHSNVINHIAIGEQGELYLATISGVNRLHNGIVTDIPAFNNMDVNQILEDSYGTLWVAAEEGLVRWNGSADIFEHFSEENGLPARQVSGLTFDQEGSLWVSTKKAGLLRFKVGKVHTLSALDGLTSDEVNIINKKGDSLIVGTDNGEINILYNGKFSEFVCDKDFQHAGIRDFLFDHEGAGWIANYNGLLKVTPTGKKKFNIKNGLPANEVRRIFEDSQNRIWIATRTAGAVLFDEQGDHTLYNKANGLSSNYIFSIEEDRKKNIVVGTNAGGLSVIDQNGTANTYHFDDDNSGILIFNTHIDHDNSYLLCTNIGLYHFSDGHFTPIAIGDATDPITLFDLIEDNKGSFWLTSNIGILRINKNDLYRFLKGEITLIDYELFDKNEGMLSNECTGATRSFLDETTGKIYVPTFKGVAVIDPSIEIENKLLPHIDITSFKVDDRAVDIYQPKIIVEPGAFRYTFDFTALSFLSPRKVQFKYKLDGIDKDWIGPGHHRTVEYTNLPHGKYTFKVMGTNSKGLWSDHVASAEFTVLPRYYETSWFYILLCIILGLILLLIYKWRVRDITKTNLALAKINTELDRFVYSASHDLRAPLASTIALVNIAKVEPNEQGKNEYLELIEECVGKMDQFITDIIDFSRNKNQETKPEEFNIEELASDIFDNLKYLKKASNVECSVTMEGDKVVFADKLRVKMLLSNLIANAINYSNEDNNTPFVRIAINNKGAYVTITVEDNGIGISDKEKEKVFEMFYRAHEQSKGSGLGLYIVQECIEKLKGKISMTSEVGKGTRFDISIPKA